MGVQEGMKGINGNGKNTIKKKINELSMNVECLHSS